MKGKMPEIATGRLLLIAKQKKERWMERFLFLTHFLLSLVYVVHIFSQRGELKITECLLLPFTGSHIIVVAKATTDIECIEMNRNRSIHFLPNGVKQGTMQILNPLWGCSHPELKRFIVTCSCSQLQQVEQPDSNMRSVALSALYHRGSCHVPPLLLGLIANTH